MNLQVGSEAVGIHPLGYQHDLGRIKKSLNFLLPEGQNGVDSFLKEQYFLHGTLISRYNFQTFMIKLHKITV